MALSINELKRQPEGGMYISPRRICLTSDDELCDETDQRAATLLVGEGCPLPLDVAERYGLIGEPKPEKTEAEEPKAEASSAPTTRKK